MHFWGIISLFKEDNLKELRGNLIHDARCNTPSLSADFNSMVGLALKATVIGLWTKPNQVTRSEFKTSLFFRTFV